MNRNLSLSKKSLLGFLFTAYGMAISVCGYAQSMGAPQPAKVNMPTSPQAAIIQRFGDIPIGYYTGTANISVPLYTLSEGGVSIPVNVSYHSSGIKVEDQATWVGLGWALAPEGQIVQEVRGKNDDDDFDVPCTGSDYSLFQQRFSPYLPAEDYNSFWQYGRVNASEMCGNYLPHASPWNYPYQDPYCILDQLLRGVGQPDIYHYSFGQYSGKFYINPLTNALVLLDKKEGVVFQKVSSTLIRATTPDGNLYSFGVIEMANAGSLTEYTGKTFKLSSITLLNGRTIDFTYVDEHYTESRRTEWADAMGTQALGIQFNNTSKDHSIKRLSRISSTDTYIDFNVSSRDDINMPSTADNATKLSYIDITSRASNKKIKRFEFTYTYFGAGGIDDKRLKLDKVQEVGFTDAGTAVTNMPPTQFSYDMSVALPSKNSFAMDFWGYYNGSSNLNKVPDLDYFDYLYKEEYSTINLAKKYAYTGSNRFTNNAYAGAAMLNKITYPTGGYTQFGYEPNSFTNQFIPDQSQPYTKYVLAQDNSISGSTNRTKSFKLTRSTTIHFVNSINNGKGNYNGVTPLTYAQMQGCYIKLGKFSYSTGSPVYTLIKQWDLSTVLNADFTTNGGKTWTEDVRVDYDPLTLTDPYFNFQVTVEFPDNLNNVNFASIAGVTSSFVYSDDTGVDVSESHQGGMRIKTIKNYTESGTLASDKLIKYYEGKLLNKFRPMSVEKVNIENVAFVDVGISHEYIGFYKKMTVPDSDFGTGGGNLIGYGKVEEIELVGGLSVSGKKVFTYSNDQNKTRQNSPYIPAPMNGELLKEQTYDAANNLVAEKLNTYTLLPTQPAKYVCLNIVKTALGYKVPCSEENMPTPFTTQYYDNYGDPYPSTLYKYDGYTIQGAYYKLMSTTTKLYNSGGVVSSTENYTYNTDGILSGKNSTNSKGQYTATSYSYASPALAASDAGYSYLLSKNVIAVPVIVENYVGSEGVSGQKMVYGAYSGLTGYWPKYTYQYFKNNQPWYLTSTVDAYDDKANITQYTGADGIPVSVVWNTDKTLPVAQVQNATYASLLALPGGLSANFRTSLPNARVVTYVYKPLIGVSQITDANNRNQYFTYDEYNRLTLVRDHDNNILKKICYNYMGQAISCSEGIPSSPIGCDPETQVTVYGANAENIAGYVAVFTNTTNPALTYTFPIPNGSSTLGCIAKGKYSLVISKPSGTAPLISFAWNTSSSTGSSATFSTNTSFLTNPTITLSTGF